MRMHSTQRTARRSVVALFAALSVALTALPAAAESFEIEFAPTEGETWTMTTVDRRSQDYAGEAQSVEQITHITLQQTYEGQPDGSWEVLQEVRSIDMSMNGEDQQTPMFAIIQSQPIRLILNSGGEATDAVGFRSLMRRYERELDPETYQNVRRQMKIANLIKGELIKWNRSLEGMHGLELEPGDRVGVKSMTEIQGNMVDVQGVIEVGEWTEVNGLRGVELTFRYDNSGEILAGAGDVRHTVERFADEEADELNLAVRILGSVESVVVPSTGQVLSEHTKETVFIPMPQRPGKTAVFETDIRNEWQPAGSDS